MINRLPAKTRNLVTGVALISPSHHAAFEIGIWSWLFDRYEDAANDLVPELEKLGDYPILCLSGTREKHCLCKDHGVSRIKTVLLPGGHHLGRDYDRVVAAILSGLGLQGKHS